ncbi:MAG: hypothetical protein ACE5I0_08855, partial [Candidatus Binatia bacterium]
LNCHQPAWIGAKNLPPEPARGDEKSLSGTAPGKTTNPGMANDMDPWALGSSEKSYPAATSIEKQTPN